MYSIWVCGTSTVMTGKKSISTNLGIYFGRKVFFALFAIWVKWPFGRKIASQSTRLMCYDRLQWNISLGLTRAMVEYPILKFWVSYGLTRLIPLPLHFIHCECMPTWNIYFDYPKCWWMHIDTLFAFQCSMALPCYRVFRNWIKCS